MEKISITIDLTKLDKSRIVERPYTNAAGETVTAKEYKMDVVPLKESKIIKEGNGWAMVKKYFVVQAQTKEERTAKAPSLFLGDGIVFVDTNAPEAAPEAAPETLKDSDVPF